ncbi:MAG: iron-containing alcohol dehydrogenase [Burkholderiales bacterium]
MNRLKKAGYRIFQFVFYNASHFLKWRTPVVLRGAGSALKLPEEIARFGVSRVLFVTDSTIMGLGLPDRLLAALDDAGIAYTIFDRIMENPTIDVIEETRKAYIDGACGGFIAFGGGSVIDSAKAAAARIARPKRTIPEMGGFLKVRRRLPPVFAVPTTAGTGSEVTIAAVVTDSSTHHKYAVSDPVLIPVCCALDPELTKGLPPVVTANTGMDALTHAVEAYITRGVTKRCKKLSEDAVRLIFANIKRAYDNGDDIEARQNMLLASFYAGDSFTRAGLTYVHPIAHTLGGLYNEPHGRANAVILPYVLEAFGSSIYAQLARLSEAAGLDVKDKSEREAALEFISAIRELNRSMGIPDKLKCVNSVDVPRIVEWAVKEGNPWYPVPRIFGESEISAIVGRVMEANMNKIEILNAQRKFFDTGATLDVSYRADALKKLLDALEANERRLLDALHSDLGKSDCEGYMTEIGMCRDELRFLIKNLRRWAKPRTVATPLAQFAAHSFVVPEPFGVALIISPWNYPVLLSIDPLAGAIAAGNCVMLKPSNKSPETSRVLAEMIAGIFPPEFVSVILGSRKENADLLDYKYDYMFFTGSVSAGRTVMEAAAKNLTPVSLELGGKSPVIVDETADIPLTAKRLAFGKYINAGQTCVAPDHVYVHQSKQDELVSELRKAINEFYPGGLEDPNLPKIVDEEAFDRLLGLIEGEQVAIGGRSSRETLKIEPTVLTGITWDSPIMGQEVFGPLLPVLTYTDIDETIKTIKAHPKPLALYLFTKNKALQKRVLREVPFGGGCVNDTIIHLATHHMGFGGVGESGMGAYHGKLSFDTFTHYKSIVDKKTWIDLPVRYAPFTKQKEKMLRMFLK